MSNCDFSNKMHKCNSLSRKEVNLENLKTTIATEKCLKDIEINVNRFLDQAITKVLDKRKIKYDNDAKINALRTLIENFISTLHQDISSYKYGFDSKFKLYIQRYDSSNSPTYNIGYGSSSNPNESSDGNLPTLSPFKFNYEIVNGIPTYLFSYPGISILYDVKNVSLGIKVWDINNNDGLKNMNKSKELILNMVPEIGEASWNVYNIFVNARIQQINVFDFDANFLTPSTPANNTTDLYKSTSADQFNIIGYNDIILINLDHMNWGNTITVSYPDDNVSDAKIELQKHINGYGPNSARYGSDLILSPVTFYFKIISGTIDTSKRMVFKINIWDVNTNNSKNYSKIESLLFESTELLKFLDYIDNKFNTVTSIRENIQKRGYY